MTALKPFLKWVGSKRQLLPELVKELPEKIGHYYEPFLGGGALFFELRARGWAGKATLGDSNERLIRTYLGVRNDVEEVIEDLQTFRYDKNEYLTTAKPTGEERSGRSSSHENLRSGRLQREGYDRRLHAPAPRGRFRDHARLDRGDGSREDSGQ